MITVIETLSIYEFIGSHCVMNNKSILHFDNPRWSTFDDTKKTACLEWLADYCPDDIIEAIRGERDCGIEYGSEEVAVLNASEWFPPQSVCPDPDYYFRALVFDNNANIVFENTNPPASEG